MARVTPTDEVTFEDLLRPCPYCGEHHTRFASCLDADVRGLLEQEAAR